MQPRTIVQAWRWRADVWIAPGADIRLIATVISVWRCPVRCRRCAFTGSLLPHSMRRSRDRFRRPAHPLRPEGASPLARTSIADAAPVARSAMPRVNHHGRERNIRLADTQSAQPVLNTSERPALGAETKTVPVVGFSGTRLPQTLADQPTN